MEELKKLVDDSDWEVAHVKADGVLVSLLEDLGYTEVVEIYDEIGKWYA